MDALAQPTAGCGMEPDLFAGSACRPLPAAPAHAAPTRHQRRPRSMAALWARLSRALLQANLNNAYIAMNAVNIANDGLQADFNGGGRGRKQSQHLV